MEVTSDTGAATGRLENEEEKMNRMLSHRRLRAGLAKWVFACLLAMPLAPLAAQSPYVPQDGWLAYAPVERDLVLPPGRPAPDSVLLLGESPAEQTALAELLSAWQGMLGQRLRVQRADDARSADGDLIVLGTAAQVRKWQRKLAARDLAPEAFDIAVRARGDDTLFMVQGGDGAGVLYGVYALLREIAQQKPLHAVERREAPAAPIRWTNEWDNLDGSIERGYAGLSIFFENGTVREDLSRVPGYARLLASVGINGVTINNVNADPRLLEPRNLDRVAEVAALFRPYGIRVSMSIKMNSPQAIGGLESFDPLLPEVRAWWNDKIEAIYNKIPDFGGFVIKADSEGQPGPAQYGRSPADAANVVARPLRKHGGIVLYRGFVYNHHLDWTDPKADRARAGYDIFRPYDGSFDDNVIIQIKHGPIDFQVREPVSPLFAGLEHSNTAIELQITQEYLGQQWHLVYLPPMWKEALDTDMQIPGKSASRVSDIVTGRTFERPLSGFVGVSNVGLDDYWLGHPLALANLYGFGRLAWNPALSSEAIVDEWTRQSFGNAEPVLDVIGRLQLESWNTYENYSGNLGIGTLTDILHTHFGPGVESSERNGWGQWHRSDGEGTGMDRTVATGTGYIGQYPAALAAQYESLDSCPESLLLFMHHVPYTHRLRSGKTVIQTLYDLHYEGADAAAAQVPAWQTLHGAVPDAVYFEVLRRLRFQAGHAVVWRDAVTRWFHRQSGIEDEQGRVGRYAHRHEFEAMTLAGYEPVAVMQWETASGDRAVRCGAASCTAGMAFEGEAGWYDLAVQYFDLPEGEADYQLRLNGEALARWQGRELFPTDRIGGHNSVRRVIAGVALRPGDRLQLQGHSHGADPAALDYLEIRPAAGR